MSANLTITAQTIDEAEEKAGKILDEFYGERGWEFISDDASAISMTSYGHEESVLAWEVAFVAEEVSA